VPVVDTPATPTELPLWELGSLFPGPESREFAAAQEALDAAVIRLRALYDERGVRAAATAEDPAVVGEILAATNEVLAECRTLDAYLYGLVTTDARDDVAGRLRSQLQAQQAILDSLAARLDGWVGRIGAARLVEASPVAADHAYPLIRAEQSARHRMNESEEDLLAELTVTGAKAWARLHSDVTARLAATLHHADGTSETMPVTMARAKATHADAAVRRAAYDAELRAWEEAAVPLAAALNAIKGETTVVARRRGWAHPLEPALWANGVDRATLDAMQAAARASFADFRRYLRAKATLLGHPAGLPWWDLMAPVGATGGSVSWPVATAAVADVFASYSPQLAGLATRAFEERWVDAQPRDGKVGGAFCMAVRGGESRVLVNFDGSWDGTQTLAHELGHAYHNAVLADRSPLQRRTPMALAETASIFCETLMANRALQGVEGAERLARLDTDLVGSCQVVVDIDSRFRFEQAVFDRRRHGTLGVHELCALMTDAQAATYGDGLDPATYHPYMWAVKPHYYSSSFYNWPYTFGLLFGIGLHARYAAEPERFRTGYDSLLAATGLGSAADLAARFEIDITSVAFWEASLDVIRARIDEFVALASAG